MPKTSPSNPTPTQEVIQRVADAILNFISQIPASTEPQQKHPEQAARKVAGSAAAKAALAAGTLALPPGPLGWVTILPELIAVWKIQARMVADIAAIYGRRSTLSREQMLYCLFRHLAAQAVRDVVVRVGERMLVRRVSLRTLQGVVQKIGVTISQRALGKSISRWLPVVGALGVGAYAYVDTGQVAKTATELFEGIIEIEAEPVD